MATVAGAIDRFEGQREKRYSRISVGAHRHHPSCSLCCSTIASTPARQRRPSYSFCCSVLSAESTCMGHRLLSLDAL
ncbi:hypothetical protein B296_00028877 [Ensete ventricosum]|uniref:Uncharacterized protein n=1 Tax=Ensete ventricosum TaxID=4639 RepID=A0A426Z1X0_ENSVE|nr:hypothetical protein B296_00028877 [Ensete ventricosum]